jgi:lauroyl/myristoyl acyltransferase
VFTTYGATIADYVAVGNMKPSRAASLCAESHGSEHLEEARRAGRGAILATGHFGFFEYGALLLGHMGYPVTVVTLSEHTRELTEWRANFRRRWGAETIEIGPDPFSSLRVLHALGAGGFAAMLADRPLGGPSIPIDLPNGRIAFSTSPALLAWMADCPVVPVTVARRADGHYRIVSRACIWPRRFAGERGVAVEAATRAVAAALFDEIARTPHQWYQFVPVGL